MAKSEMNKQTFYIILQGKKQGPYEKAEIVNLIKNQNLLVTDSISCDEGKTWKKVFEYQDLQAHHRDSKELPFPPKSKVRDLHNKESHLAPSDDADGLVSLAYVEKVKNGKVSQNKDDQNYSASPSQDANDTLIARAFYALLFVVSISGMSFLFWPDQNKHEMTSLNPTDHQQGQGQAQVLEPVESFNPEERRQQANQNRRPASQQQKHQTREQQARSASENSPFQRQQRERRNQRRARQDDSRTREMRPPASLEVISDDREDYYYDTRARTYELDPVRSHLSHDVIDPVDENGDYYYDNDGYYGDYDDQYDSNSGRSRVGSRGAVRSNRNTRNSRRAPSSVYDSSYQDDSYSREVEFGESLDHYDDIYDDYDENHDAYDDY